MRNQFFRTLSAWCFKSTLSTYEPTMESYNWRFIFCVDVFFAGFRIFASC